MLNIYAHTFMTATRTDPRYTRVTLPGRRRWWQTRRTALVDLNRL